MTQSVLEIEAGDLPPFPEFIPSHWQTALDDEPVDITRVKVERAKKLGVPAVLFTEEQVREQIVACSEFQSRQHTGNSLYITIEKGGGPLAVNLHQGLNDVADSEVEEDSFGITFEQKRGRSRSVIHKALDEVTVISERDIILVDTAIRQGSMLNSIAACFRSKLWTINNLAHGGSAATVSALSMTQRESVVNDDLSGLDSVTSLFLTPSGIRTAGWGANDERNRLRNCPDIVIPRNQLSGTEEQVERVLLSIGDRAVMGMDDIKFHESIR